MSNAQRGPSQTSKSIVTRYEMPPRCSVRYFPLDGVGAAPLHKIGVILAGVNELTSGYIHAQVDPPWHSLLLTIKGRGLIRTPHRTFRPAALSLAILPAHCAFECTIADNSWKVLWFILADIEHWASLRLKEVVVRHAHFSNAIGNIVEAVLWESVHEPLDADHVSHLMCELLTIYIERELLVGVNPRELRVQRLLQNLWDRVNGDLQRTWTVEDLAEEVHMSPSNLHRVVSLHTGMTPMAKVAELRMRRAVELLRYGSHLIKNVAAMVGYDNPFSFSTAFKKHCGVSPRAFRNRKEDVRRIKITRKQGNHNTAKSPSALPGR